MISFFKKTLFLITSLLTCGVLSLNTGCASGGYKLTRKYASWVNSNNVIIRVILYLLTAVVFAVTMIIDLVLFNTIDFWDGKVSQGDFEFKDGDKTFYVKHELLPGTQLRRSTIKVHSPNQNQLVVLSETPKGEIEMYIDGKLHTKVKDIAQIPLISRYDVNGNEISATRGLLAQPVALK